MVLCHIAGFVLDVKKVVWGDWSVESQYVTLGQAAATAPAAAAAAAPSAGSGKKKNKKPAGKSTEKKMSSAAAQQAVADEQHALQQLQVRVHMIEIFAMSPHFPCLESIQLRRKFLSFELLQMIS